jgi:lipopolysaccharide transport system permease protein
MSQAASSAQSAGSYRARFRDPVVESNGAGQLRLRCTLENVGGAAWSEHAASAEGDRGDGPQATIGPVRLGYQVFDARSGRRVLDGAHTGLGQEWRPGEARPIAAEIALPPGEGLYRIVVSPVQEEVAWFYERGSEFLEIEVMAAAGRVDVRSVRQATRSRERARRAAQLLARFIAYPVRNLLRHRSLIASLVRRDIVGRYRGSVGGAFWTVFHPLLLMVAYYFVFAVVLRVRFGAGQGSGDFVFYFLCGMLPWLAFSEAVGRSPNVVLDHSNFVKRVVFPLEILPLNLTLTGLVTEFFALLIFLAALLGTGRGLDWTAVYLPVILVPQLLLTAGLCWFLAALGVFLRDIGQIMGFVLTVWFFATPIVYPASALPEGWLWLFEKNPMYTVVEAYRAVFLESSPPSATPLLVLWAVAVAAFWLGYAWFYKVRKSFADLI